MYFSVSGTNSSTSNISNTLSKQNSRTPLIKISSVKAADLKSTSNNLKKSSVSPKISIKQVSANKSTLDENIIDYNSLYGNQTAEEVVYNLARTIDEAKRKAAKIVEEHKKIVEKDAINQKITEFITRQSDFVKNEEGEGPYKYRKWYYGYDSSGDEWCTTFVNWIFNHNGNSKLYIEPKKDTLAAGEGIEESIKAGYGKWYEDERTDSKTVPKVGDVICFTRGMDENSVAPWGYDENGNIKKHKWITPYGSDHVGYVYKVDDEKVYTIEGNTGDNDSDASKVNKRWYYRDDNTINGYYRPNYENAIEK